MAKLVESAAPAGGVAQRLSQVDLLLELRVKIRDGTANIGPSGSVADGMDEIIHSVPTS